MDQSAQKESGHPVASAAAAAKQTESDIPPTVGRIVHYRQAFGNKTVTCAAIITEVKRTPDTIKVNLFVWLPEGGNINVPCAVYSQEQDAAGTWFWPKRV